MALETSGAAGRNGESGFTLIELAIVLVIIGLIVGGVLQGQALITNARTTNYQNSAQGYIAAIETYRQRYNVFPGDDSNAVERFELDAAGDSGDGDGNGSIEASNTDSEDETTYLWSHLRAAGLITGAKDDISYPTNPFGGTFRILDTTTFGLAAPVLCSSNIDGDVASIIDTALDDGQGDQGRIRGEVPTSQAAPFDGLTADNTASPGIYVQADTYTICHRL